MAAEIDSDQSLRKQEVGSAPAKGMLANRQGSAMQNLVMRSYNGGTAFPQTRTAYPSFTDQPQQ